MANYLFKNVRVIECHTAAIIHCTVNAYDRNTMLMGTLAYLVGNAVSFYCLGHYYKYVKNIIIYKIKNACFTMVVGNVVIKVAKGVKKKHLVALFYTLSAYGRYYISHIVRLYA